jgi:hypothetical protein
VDIGLPSKFYVPRSDVEINFLTGGSFWNSAHLEMRIWEKFNSGTHVSYNI